MRLAFTILILLHGLAHLVGFRAAFWPHTISSGELAREPSRLEGVAWLLLALGFIASAGLLLLGQPAWLALLTAASGASLVLCYLAWPDARVGAVINAVLLVAALLLVSQGDGSLRAAFRREIERRAVRAGATQPAPVDEASLSTLPETARRYLRFMNVIGRPRDSSILARFDARFRLDDGAWLPCRVLQYDTRAPVTRVFVMSLRLDHVLPVTVRDDYLAGRGSMQARAFDRVLVADGRGPELDVGELVTYLNDAILMAPSLVLGPETTWTHVDADTFQVTLRDGALGVTARVRVNAEGAPTLFSTTDRFFDAPDGKRVRTEWRTPIDGWQEAGGRKLPTRARAVWQLPEGPFTYADFSFDPAQIAFNVPPI